VPFMVGADLQKRLRTYRYASAQSSVETDLCVCCVVQCVGYRLFECRNRTRLHRSCICTFPALLHCSPPPLPCSLPPPLPALPFCSGCKRWWQSKGFVLLHIFTFDHCSVQDMPWLYYGGVGLVQGVGYGCLYLATLQHLMKWFPDKPGIFFDLSLVLPHSSCQRLSAGGDGIFCRFGGWFVGSVFGSRRYGVHKHQQHSVPGYCFCSRFALSVCLGGR
jgi:hypothetical protein